MTRFLRLATASALLASLGGLAHAQSYAHRASNDPTQFYALYGANSESAYRTQAGSGVVPPSVSHTVMGLSVPR